MRGSKSLTSLIVLLIAAPVLAQSTWVNSAAGNLSGSWGEPSNWRRGLIPTINSDATISNGGTAAIAGLIPAQVRNLTITNGGLNFLQPQATDLTVGSFVYVGTNNGTGEVHVSDYANGRTIDWGGAVHLGFRDNSLGRYYQDRGTVIGDTFIDVGYGSPRDNEMILEGSANVTIGGLSIGNDGNTFASGKGTVRVGGEAVLRLSNILVASYFGSGTHPIGRFEQSGGEVYVRSVEVAGADDADGLIVVREGLFDVEFDLRLAGGNASFSGRGRLRQDGGILNVGRDFIVNAVTSHGRVDISNGTLDVTRDLRLGVANWGDAVVAQTGGQVTVGNDLVIGTRTRLANDRRYTISAGTLDVVNRIVLATSQDQGQENRFEVVGSLAEIHAGGLRLGSTADRVATLSFDLDAGGISALQVDGPVELNFGNGNQQLEINLIDAAPKHDFVLINKLDFGPISGVFDGMPEDSQIERFFNGARYLWELSYHYDATSMTQGGGNDLALIYIAPEPTCAMHCLVSSIILLVSGALRKRAATM